MKRKCRKCQGSGKTKWGKCYGCNGRGKQNELNSLASYRAQVRKDAKVHPLPRQYKDDTYDDSPRVYTGQHQPLFSPVPELVLQDQSVSHLVVSQPGQQDVCHLP